MLSINDDYYEDLTEENRSNILDEIKKGGKSKAGPRSKHYAVELLPGLTLLIEPPKGPGFRLRKELQYFYIRFVFVDIHRVKDFLCWRAPPL